MRSSRFSPPRTRSGFRPTLTTREKSRPISRKGLRPAPDWRGCPSTIMPSCSRASTTAWPRRRSFAGPCCGSRSDRTNLFHCDPVTGAGHFRTPVWKGIEIIEGLRGHISGLGVPTYVVDAPRGGGKIPLMPNYLLSASNDSVVLRNYEGMIVHYHPTGDAVETPSRVETQGVSGLLEGHSEVLIPEGNPRHARRPARPPLIAKGPHLNGKLKRGTGS